MKCIRLLTSQSVFKLYTSNFCIILFGLDSYELTVKSVLSMDRNKTVPPPCVPFRFFSLSELYICLPSTLHSFPFLIAPFLPSSPLQLPCFTLFQLPVFLSLLSYSILSFLTSFFSVFHPRILFGFSYFSFFISVHLPTLLVSSFIPLFFSSFSTLLHPCPTFLPS